MNQPMQLHLDILDQPRQKFWLQLAPLSTRFYLAGGTALALQIGHRDSIDFDFFTTESIDPLQLLRDLEVITSGYQITVTQSASNTLSLLVNGTIRLSFYSYTYSLVQSLVQTSSVPLASPMDIGCMKLSAILGRSTYKDYVDLYVILHEIPLAQLLESARHKFPEIDTNVVLKALVYFDDIQDEPVNFAHGFSVTRPELEHFIRETVRPVVITGIC